jgi:methionyl-tRNA formyltransferase
LDQELDVIQPKKLSDPGVLDQLRAWNPTVIVVAAYGQILPQVILDLPKEGCINVHASLLPRWRGAAPVQHALLHGDLETGVTIMLMDAGLDTGPILSQQSIMIEPEETGGELSDRLAVLGGELLSETLPRYVAQETQPEQQDDTLATYAPMLKKRDGMLLFHRPAQHLGLQVRAYEPWPTSFFMWRERRIVVRKAHAIPLMEEEPGQVVVMDEKPTIITSEGALVLDIVQPAGKNQMTGDAFLRGSQEIIGATLAFEPPPS